VKKQELVAFLNDLFLSLGFKRKGNNWANNGEILTKIINLQKSNYSNRYYINYGFIICKLPLTTTTHITYRLAASAQKENELIVDLLDLESKIEKEERLPKLRELISAKVIRRMQPVNDEESLLIEIKKMPYSSMIPIEVKKHFNLPEWHGSFENQSVQ
jgi:hypothetical protein